MDQTPHSLLDCLRDCPGDSVAWARFESLYRPLLRFWLTRHRLQQSDCDDLLQEVLHTVLRELPTFRYDPSRGRFRSWLRAILINRLREFWRSQRMNQLPPEEKRRLAAELEQLEATNGDLHQQWDREHDQHVLSRLLELVRPEFADKTWQAFERLMKDQKAADVACELGMTVNAVYLAKSGILKRLRTEARGLLE